ncbi:MAG: transposase, partial [Alphaproteobacteria bacterium]|nr:transposase [Alphaproteobacteria bacterium]
YEDLFKKIKIEAWRREYNSQRPHSPLGNMISEEFASFQNFKKE